MRGTDSDKVVFLAYSNEKVREDTQTFVACGHCRNKTFTLIPPPDKGFNMVRCAACGQDIGRMGWADGNDSQK